MSRLPQLPNRKPKVEEGCRGGRAKVVCRGRTLQADSEAGKQAGKSIAITTNSRNGKRFEMRITFYVFAGVFHLVFLHFPLFHFATFLFWSSSFFYSCCSCSGSARMARVCLDCLAKHVHCDFVHEIHVVLRRPGAQREPTRRSKACAIDPGN